MKVCWKINSNIIFLFKILCVLSGADVGFEQSVYTVQEGEDVELCVRILSPNEADVFVFLLANTVEDTATGTYTCVCVNAIHPPLKSC